MKLKSNQLEMVRLYNRSVKDVEGWTNVSAVIWPLISDLPKELFDIEGDANGGRVRANELGSMVIPYL